MYRTLVVLNIDFFQKRRNVKPIMRMDGWMELAKYVIIMQKKRKMSVLRQSLLALNTQYNNNSTYVNTNCNYGTRREIMFQNCMIYSSLQNINCIIASLGFWLSVVFIYLKKKRIIFAFEVYLFLFLHHYYNTMICLLNVFSFFVNCMIPWHPFRTY